MPMTVIAESAAQNHVLPHIAHLGNGRSFVIDGPLVMGFLPAILAAKSAPLDLAPLGELPLWSSGLALRLARPARPPPTKGPVQLLRRPVRRCILILLLAAAVRCNF